MERGHSSWGMSLLCSSLYWLRIKATFLFPPNSLSVYFIWLRWAEKPKILASNSFCYLMKNFNSPHYSSLLQNPDHSTRSGILLILYNAKLEGKVQEKFWGKNTCVNKHGLKRPSETWDQVEKRGRCLVFCNTAPIFSGQWPMSYNSTQFWYYQPEDSTRLHRLSPTRLLLPNIYTHTLDASLKSRLSPVVLTHLS